MTAQDNAKVANPSVPIIASSLMGAHPAPPEVRRILARTAKRYRCCSRFARNYVPAKLRADPVHREILALAAFDAFGSVLDVGCGYGQLGLALLEAGLADSVLGLDRSGKHLQQAQMAARMQPFQARLQDLEQVPALSKADTVLLIDVLYQLSRTAQDCLVEQAGRAARRWVIVRTCDLEQGMRSRFSSSIERLFRLVWPNAGRYVNPRPISSLREILERAGFVVECRPCWQGTPFANVLVIAGRL